MISSSIGKRRLAEISQTAPKGHVRSVTRPRKACFSTLGSTVGTVYAYQLANRLQVDAALGFLGTGGFQRALSSQLAAHVFAVVEVCPGNFLQLHELEIIFLFFLLSSRWCGLQGDCSANC